VGQVQRDIAKARAGDDGSAEPEHSAGRTLLSRHKARSALGIALELVLISLAVFIGLLADEWREIRSNHALAHGALERFRTEVAANRAAVEGVVDYHRELRQRLEAFLASIGPKDLRSLTAQAGWSGVRPVRFEQTAWELALATGALNHIAPDLAFSLSGVYTAQSAMRTYQDSFTQAAMAPGSFTLGDATGLAIALDAYLADMVIQEPRLVERYAQLLDKLDMELGPRPD
jgi:hypothetical protein